MLQICGTVLIGLSLICGTWYGVTVTNLKMNAERRERARRAAHNEAVFSDRSLALYTQTEAMLADAKTKIGIQSEQLKRRDAEIERLKKLLKEAEK